jgi:predicted glycoside hydrolase/deacetylase ChbG (UPF0249 family)
MPQLIVNADDFGFSPGVNQGILHAHKNGLVTSTTVMVNLPYAEVGVHQLLTEAPAIGMGVHINLTLGRPVSSPQRVASLVDESGYFYPETKIAEIATRFDGDELYEEIAAQIEHFIAITGRTPTHLDSHFHIAFLHPLALQATLALAAEYGHLPLRETVLNAPFEQLFKRLQWFIPTVSEPFAQQLIPIVQAITEENQPYMPAHFESGFNGPATTLGDLLNLLVALDPDRPTEVMCHPGILDDPLNPKAPLRQRELDALTHPAAREVVERYNIELISFAAFHRPLDHKED